MTVGFNVGLGVGAMMRRRASALPVIAILSGSGLAGSVYVSTVPSQWTADGVAIPGETGATYTMSLANEGKAIRCGLSNVIEMWVPTDAAGLVALLDIRQGVSQTGGSVSAWASQVGGVSGVQGTGASMPTFNATFFGASTPGLSFDGDDNLKSLAIATNPAARTVLTLANFASAGLRSILGGSSANNYGLRRQQNPGAQALGIVATNTAIIGSSTTLMSLQTDYLISARHVNAIGQPFGFRFDGDDAGSGACAAACAGGGTMQIGVQTASSSPMHGGLSSMLVYDAYLSDADNARAEGWLAHTLNRLDKLTGSHAYKTAAPRIS